MKTLVAVLLASIILSGPAFAGNGENGGKSERGQFRRGQRGCSLKLSDEQKEKMSAKRFKFQEAQIDMKAEYQHARLNYKKLMSDPATDYRTAKAAAEEVSKLKAKMIAAKQAFHTEIAFTIFSADQRVEAQKCHHFGRRHPGMRRFAGNDDGQTLAFDEGRGPVSEEGQSSVVEE